MELFFLALKLTVLLLGSLTRGTLTTGLKLPPPPPPGNGFCPLMYGKVCPD